MQIESVLWLLPVVFMIHDFEEIIMIRPWLSANGDQLRARFPRLSSRLLPKFEQMSQSAFALAVAEEFIVISLFTLLAVENGWYNLWTALLLVFFAHCVVHIAQFALFRRYVPVLLTSLLATAYSLWAVVWIGQSGLIAWSRLLPWTGFFVAAAALNYLLAVWIAGRFNRWLTSQWVG